LGYTFLQIIFNDTHIEFMLVRLLKAFSSITDMLLFCIALRHDIYLLELKPKHTNNTASSDTCPALHTEKLTVMLVWEQTYLRLKACLKTIWEKNDVDRYVCTTCSLQHLASTWVHPGFSMGSMLLIFVVSFNIIKYVSLKYNSRPLV
jgi:hypothetical protein